MVPGPWSGEGFAAEKKLVESFWSPSIKIKKEKKAIRNTQEKKDLPCQTGLSLRGHYLEGQ